MYKFLHYKTSLLNDLGEDKLPGVSKFIHFSKMYSADVVPFDRTGTVKIPINVENLFPIPVLRVFTKSYEEICNDRAKELLLKAENLGVNLYVMYSGGIDSTLILVSLLKNATESQKQNIVVLMSEDSVKENPVFYRDHINGHLKVDASMNFKYILGSKNILVSGEHNDQLFGADVIGHFMALFGEEEAHKPYDKEKIISFFNSKVDNPHMNTFYVNLFEKLAMKAPVKIDTNFLFFWWINFSIKWQCVYFRTLMYISEKNAENITEEYLKNHYFTFYGTEDFQLWSMNNLDKRMKESWKTYKWPAKEIIYKYNKDAEYRDNKAKVASLPKVVIESSYFYFFDTDYKFYKEIDLTNYYNPDNDFV